MLCTHIKRTSVESDAALRQSLSGLAVPLGLAAALLLSLIDQHRQHRYTVVSARKLSLRNGDRSMCHTVVPGNTLSGSYSNILAANPQTQYCTASYMRYATSWNGNGSRVTSKSTEYFATSSVTWQYLPGF